MMTEEPSAEDNRKKLNAAENLLAHMKDLSRLIDQRGPAIHQQMTPFDKAHRDKFTEEYEELFLRGNR